MSLGGSGGGPFDLDLPEAGGRFLMYSLVYPPAADAAAAAEERPLDAGGSGGGGGLS